jgi:hypothetical protein
MWPPRNSGIADTFSIFESPGQIRGNVPMPNVFAIPPIFPILGFLNSLAFLGNPLTLQFKDQK